MWKKVDFVMVGKVIGARYLDSTSSVIRISRPILTNCRPRRGISCSWRAHSLIAENIFVAGYHPLADSDGSRFSKENRKAINRLLESQGVIFELRHRNGFQGC